MESSRKDPKSIILKWYAQQQPLTVDIVGDFAGRELFIIHGESLIRHCLAQSKVDFDGGFQLLHAVYAVEDFLHNLHKRGCNFDIVFFRKLAPLCAPADVAPENVNKYVLTRAILIRHLAKSACKTLEFESFDSERFREYLASNAVHFALCHDGEAGGEDDSTVQLRHFISRFIRQGTNVAIINTVSWKSSKVFAALYSGSSRHVPLSKPKPSGEEEEPSDSELALEGMALDGLEMAGSSLREHMTVIVCRRILDGGSPPGQQVDSETVEHVQAMLLHAAMLGDCSVGQRACRGSVQHDPDDVSRDRSFLRSFARVSLRLVEGNMHKAQSAGGKGLDWDLYDLVDGRLFFLLLEKLRKGESFSEKIAEKARKLWEATTRGCRFPPDDPFDPKVSDNLNADQASSEAISNPAILSFNHPILDKYLEDVKVDEAEESIDPAAQIVFEDLHHWHVYKGVVAGPKTVRPGFWTLKNNQRQMAEIINYAASLTNSRGKTLERETIIVGPRQTSNGGGLPQTKPAQKQNVIRGGKKKGPQKGGRDDALKAAQQLQGAKTQEKQDSLIKHWSNVCSELQKNDGLVGQYIKAEDFLMSRPKESQAILAADIRIFLCHLLVQLWAKTRAAVDKDSTQGLYLVSMMWRWTMEISKATSCPVEIARAVEGLAKALQMPDLQIDAGQSKRRLPFHIGFDAVKNAIRLFQDPRLLQLRYGGPYLDRRFDSGPDPRVNFDPDAWQRKVLDSIDANESLLVLAPTSAGKTFISFYAMKKVLEESDDAVLVYVAPTKALVNQIAAEIEARFSKSYQGKGGKSVWAIHTRDYRINNPSGCQILVTVPHILQIMLLAPANAGGPKSWSQRVKRIIFDEVHCIGQAEDGVIWEQLLLLAPCPIIALSATVGNPEEFRDWLSQAQAQKGFRMAMVVHTARYSDLRKFIYNPPKATVFDGLNKAPRLPVPGLDEGDVACGNFEFIHPVAALKDRNRGALEDVSFEARDCLTLWETMQKTLPSELTKEAGHLDPKAVLPKIVSKSDVLKWEASLKAKLRQVMEAPETPFPSLQTGLPQPRGQEDDAEEASDEDEPESKGDHISSLFSLVCDLHAQDALPCLVFNYDRRDCERAVRSILGQLLEAEKKWKTTDPGWRAKMEQFKQWKINQAHAKKAPVVVQDGTSKLDIAREAGSRDVSPWESFDPKAPLDQFNLADPKRVQRSEFDGMVGKLNFEKIQPWLVAGLERGLGVHHAGMNRKYRQLVEVLFRKGYLRVVVATGTLALGINMPCKTVVFSGDSIFLSAQNYRQASGRAGRRGFDLLGNVVFNGIPRHRVYEIMSSRLPDLRGQFPVSTTLVLRLFGLLHGTNNSGLAVDAVRSLLSQTRLYLGGPDSEMSIKHHLRFSIEYLRRQNLLSSTGEPLNFAGMVGHLYFTENAVFALHSLFRSGYFHELCADIDRSPSKVLLEMVLVLSHLFNRIPVRRTRGFVDRVHRSSSVVFLPRLPENAEKMLMRHNKETLSIFKGYVQSYINQHLHRQPDRTLPFTKTTVGGDGSPQPDATPTSIRSPFVALSGFTDEFSSIHELCSTVRGGVFLEESAIPYIPIWPHDTDVEFNAYIYDFYKHGSLDVLVGDNHIKQGDVWFHLKDFYLTLKTIATSLKGFLRGEDSSHDLSADMLDLEEFDETKSNEEPQEEPKVAAPASPAKAGKKAKAKLLDSWEDEESDSGPQASSSDAGSVLLDGVERGGGLANVLKAFVMLDEEFDAKFKKVWA